MTVIHNPVHMHEGAFSIRLKNCNDLRGVPRKADIESFTRGSEARIRFERGAVIKRGPVFFFLTGDEWYVAPIEIIQSVFANKGGCIVRIWPPENAKRAPDT